MDTDYRLAFVIGADMPDERVLIEIAQKLYAGHIIKTMSCERKEVRIDKGTARSPELRLACILRRQ